MDLTANGENQEKTCQPSRTDTFSKSNIDECKRYVMSIQRRLDKAVANGDKSRIKWYSHILMKKSRAVKVLAVHRVCKVNQGRHTAGVDGVTTPKDKQEARVMMENSLKEIDIMKRPDLIRRVYIPKPNGDSRPLGIPTIADRINQDIIRQTIEPICEFHFLNCSYGFRPRRSSQDAMSDLFGKLNKPHSKQWVIEGDIKGCFDNIKHSHITSTLKEWNIGECACSIITSMLKSGILEESTVNATLCGTPQLPLADSRSTLCGTPQGGIISPLLANVALTCLDETMISRAGTKKETNKMVRYADDFIITARSEQEAEEIKALTKSYLKEKIGLDLSETKTHITHISVGFNFLGFNFRKYENKLLIKPSQPNIQALKDKMSDIIRHSHSAEGIISKINPILSGWGNYYRHVVSQKVFTKIEHYLWYQLQLWIKRKHLNQSVKYRIGRYFAKRGNNKWRFLNPEKDMMLLPLGSIPIKRFIKVRKDERVFDGNAIDYWQKREYINAKNSIIAEGTIMELFSMQKGNCGVCRQGITQDDVHNSRIHKHHMKPRSEGGDWKLSNLRLLHADCHISRHSCQNLL